MLNPSFFANKISKSSLTDTVSHIYSCFWLSLLHKEEKKLQYSFGLKLQDVSLDISQDSRLCGPFPTLPLDFLSSNFLQSLTTSFKCVLPLSRRFNFKDLVKSLY